jgi:proteasome accessory factor B
MLAAVSAEKINRLLRLITLLHSGQAGSPQDLADMLGVTRRTLFRDLNLLRDAGIPHYFETGKGYRIGKSYFLPAINLTVLETLGLLVLGKTAAAQRHRPMMAAALSAINKLILAIPQQLREACGDVMAHITVNPGSQIESDRESGHYVTLQRCIDEGRSCDMTYTSPTQPDSIALRLDPYALHFAARAWYVFGRSDGHENQVRMFKLARIGTLTETHHRFSRPPRFSAESFLGKAWLMIPEGRLHRIELEFTRRVATNVAEVRWHSTQTVRKHRDGRCTVKFQVDGLKEISWWICGYAQEVKVIKPKELAEVVKRMHAEAAGRYV